MTREVMDLVKAMGGGSWEDRVLEQVCEMTQQQLQRSLRPDVTAEDCGGAFTVAAAWMALAILGECGPDGDVEAFSAGGLSIRRKSGKKLRDQARTLMAPYCRERSFAFQGVRG